MLPKYLLILFFLVGCAKQQKITEYDLLYSKDDCLFHVSVTAIEQAEELSKNWSLYGCNIDAEAVDEGKPKPPPKD